MQIRKKLFKGNKFLPIIIKKKLQTVRNTGLIYEIKRPELKRYKKTEYGWMER